MDKYTIIGSETRPIVNQMGQLIDVVVIRFAWGDNHTAEIKVPQAEFDPEIVKRQILDYIAKFDALG
jgi:hypothetical protein